MPAKRFTRKKRYKMREPSEEEKMRFEQLSELLQRLGVDVRLEKGDFRNGLCVIQGERKILFLNKKYPFEQHIASMVAELLELDLDAIYVSPGVREFIETFEISRRG